MQLSLDGVYCDTAATTIAEALADGAEQARRAGRCVIEIHIDGTPLSSAELGSDELLMRGAGDVRLITATPGDVARDAFAHAGSALQQIDQLQRDAADLIQADRVPEGMQLLGEAITAWADVQQAVAACGELAGIDLDAVETGELTAALAINRLNEQLTALVDALRNQDVVTLSDTLLYEMPEVILDWRHLLSDLTERV